MNLYANLLNIYECEFIKKLLNIYKCKFIKKLLNILRRSESLLIFRDFIPKNQKL